MTIDILFRKARTQAKEKGHNMPAFSFVDTLSADKHFYAAQCINCKRVLKVYGYTNQIKGEAIEYRCEAQ